MKLITISATMMIAYVRVSTNVASAAPKDRAMTEAIAMGASASKEASAVPATVSVTVLRSSPAIMSEVKSVLAVDFTYRKAGTDVRCRFSDCLSPAGKDVGFIITDASDFKVAHLHGHQLFG